MSVLRYPSADRNKEPILDVLRKELNPNANNLKLIEISSGTGQHIAHFAPHFPHITFQPSEYDQNLFQSIRAYSAGTPAKNIYEPLHIDIARPYAQWGLQGNLTEYFDYILNINMIHIAPYECTEGLFRNAAGLLRHGGLLITYGPYAENGLLTPDSNIRFDQSLRSQNPLWGVRDLAELRRFSQQCGIELIRMYEMPSNNKCVIWQRVQ